MSTTVAHEPQELYAGPAEVAGVEVEVDLRGYFEPIDGLFHWYGRAATGTTLDDLKSGSTVTLTTPHGSAEGRVSDRDPWGRLRIAGTGRPPF